jgi:minor extracellular protease Epr
MSKRLARPASPRAAAAGLAASVLFALAVVCGAASAAQAEVGVSTQAQADNGAFLAYAPALAQPAGLCLVDTGVDLNPDTQGSVVYRTAIDGGSGDDTSADSHGTMMAMMAAAPANGWGMIGTAPTAIRIVSVRILEPGQTTFPFLYYTTAINVCLKLQTQYNIKVINLSLGTSQTPSSADYTAMTNAVEQANNYGIDVVAAAGNDTGGPLDYPAALPAVLSVGATDARAGGFCGFSNRGTGLRLLAPGCDLDAADPTSGVADENYWQGTSEASAIAAAALTALRAYQPTLTPQTAENYLTNVDNGTLNIAQAFANAGLTSIVAAGTAAEPASTTTGQPPAGPTQFSGSASTGSGTSSGGTTGQGSGDPLGRIPTPAMTVTARRGRVTAVFANRRPGMTVQLRLLGYATHKRRLVVLRSLLANTRSVTFATGSAVEVEARYRDSYDIERTSPWRTQRLPHTDASNAKQKATR